MRCPPAHPGTLAAHGFRSCALLIVVCTGWLPAVAQQEAAPLREQCVVVMRDALKDKPFWQKVHAAEFLLSLDYRSGVREIFEEEQQQRGSEPQVRIGILRVLAALDRHNSQVGPQHVRKIRDLFLDTKAPDRIHAVESLAKLGYTFSSPPTDGVLSDGAVEEAAQFAAFASDGPPSGQAYALWVLLNNGNPDAEERLAELLRSGDAQVRRTAAYVLRHQNAVRAETLQALQAAVQNETDESSAIYLLTCLRRHTSAADSAALDTRLLKKLFEDDPSAQYEMTRLAAAIGDHWTEELRALVQQNDVTLDVRSSAAHALCRIERRRTARMPTFDWGVVGVYGFVLLGIGVYFARRTKTAGDYLLGGRRMNPLAVGLSLFATLLSTLSYLAWPGEMIRNGPLILMGYAAYPFVFLVVGWFLIPSLMRMEVTSAYEILENRLGVSVRLLGSTLFLSLRFLWMASIIYWTTAIVLLPAAGLDESYATTFAVCLGIITVAYTSLGGLKAVVATDVIQTLILFVGAATSIVLITNSLGGVSAWFPNQWPEHWAPARWWFDFDPNARATVANATLGVFVWYVCTAGSDQMAIQRYMATRDVRAARRMLAVTLLTDFTVLIFLGLMGLALLSYFSTHPEQLADGQSVYQNADKLFPRFVVVGLPTGMSGLVIAGLLAAAMSSLSSGVNSSAAVISEDFVRRLTPRAKDERSQVRLARWMSVGVGLIAVGLSALIGIVEGNMLEVVYKVVNLFVAPLFFLFFMAIFVPWANAIGTWAGTLTGITVAVLIAFWKDLFGVQGISFLWIMPAALLSAIVIGSLVSLLTGGARVPLSRPAHHE